jgi:hypothetical protein
MYDWYAYQRKNGYNIIDKVCRSSPAVPRLKSLRFATNFTKHIEVLVLPVTLHRNHSQQ